MLQVTPDIVLRTYEEADAAAFFSVVEANRSHLRSWIPWVDRTTKEAHCLELIRSGKQDQQDQKALHFGIFKNDVLIGGLGMHTWNQELRKVEIGYWLVKEAEGKGLMSQCLERFLSFLFGQLDLNKVELKYLPDNKRSGILAEKFHFKIEGILRDSILVNGALRDLVVTGLLKREYKAML